MKQNLGECGQRSGQRWGGAGGGPATAGQASGVLGRRGEARPRRLGQGMYNHGGASAGQEAAQSWGASAITSAKRKARSHLANNIRAPRRRVRAGTKPLYAPAWGLGVLEGARTSPDSGRDAPGELRTAEPPDSPHAKQLKLRTAPAGGRRTGRSGQPGGRAGERRTHARNPGGGIAQSGHRPVVSILGDQGT